MSNMNVAYDGIGLVNNRGASKYWGVTTNNNPYSHANWRIQLNVSGSKIHTFYFEGCNPNEEVAASIISKFYDKRNTGIENVSYAQACDGVWYKVDPLSHKVRKLVSGRDIPTGLIKELPEQFRTQGKLDLESEPVMAPKRSQNISKYEADLISRLVNGYSSGEITDNGAKLMSQLLSIIES